jgi:hypothetical protein
VSEEPLRTMILAAAIGAMSLTASPGRAVLVVQDGLREPFGVAFDAAGNTYIVEMGGNRVSELEPNGRLRTLAGTGEQGLSGDGGPARSAELRGPKHISIDDSDQSVLIADTENHVIRRYSPGSGRISRVAGTGTPGAGGLDGPADRCELNRPHGAQVEPHSRAI